MRRALWFCLGVALLGNLAIGAVLFSKLRYGSGLDEDLTKKKWLVEIRKSLFSDYTTDLALLQASPETLIQQGFRTDPPALIEAWAREVLPTIPYLQGISPGSLAGTEVEKAKAIVLRFSKNGGPGCGHFRDLLDNLQHIADDEGYGCCADHAQAFIALGQAFGLAVRQVGHGHHTFNEIYLHDRAKWVFIDPQYAILARDERGAYLGLLEIRERFRAQQSVSYEFFGNRFHEFARKDPAQHPYYAGFEAFTDARIVWGSNVIEQDRLERRLQVLPKAARQLVGYSTGVFPPMKIYADESARLPATFRQAKRTVLALTVGLVASTGIPLLLLFATRPSAHRRREAAR